MKILLSLILLSLAFSQVKKQLTIDDVISGPDFRMETVSGTQWTPDGKGYVFFKMNDETKESDLVFYNIETGKEEIYIDSKDKILQTGKSAKRFVLNNFYWSPVDQNIILVPRDNDLFIYNKQTKKLEQITSDAKEERDPQFSPDGKKISYLKDNNLFYVEIATKQERQLTKQGNDKVLIGRFDWVYEEEFGIRVGTFWSPKSDQIAYFELTDANTDRFPIVDFIPVKNEVEMLPYPKAGADNSTVKIGRVTLDDAVNIYMDISSNKDELIPRIKWTNNNNGLAIIKMNRDQDYLDLYFATTKTGSAKLILHEEEKNGWININDDLTFVEDDYFIWKSRKNGYSHLYLHNLDGSLKRQLTSGNWEVTTVAGFSAKEDLIYFTAAKKSPLERELYSVSIKGSEPKEITVGKGTHRINFNTNFTYFLDYFSNIETAPIVDLIAANGKLKKRLIENNTKKIMAYDLGKRELFTFKTSEGVTLNGWMQKPSDFDKNKSYPVLMFQYSGPGSQQVSNSFAIGRNDKWYHLLNQKGIIVVCVDGRGTGFRGKEFEQITNHNLGDYETRDQVATADYLRSLDYIAKDKIGIWGWSYGGYMSSLAIMKYPDSFNYAIAVAPVTNWRNYDTIYTERFLSTPEKNGANYDLGSPTSYADRLKNPYLIIHGTSDDNVHFSNAVQLVEKLVHYKKQFESFYYPRSQHGMGYDGQNTQSHLFTMMTNFILKNVNLK